MPHGPRRAAAPHQSLAPLAVVAHACWRKQEVTDADKDARRGSSRGALVYTPRD